MSPATYNKDSKITLERLILNVLDRYGADVLPLAAYAFDWPKLKRIVDSTVQQFEQYVPCLRWYIAPRQRTFKMPDDCQEVRGAVIYVPNILWTDMSELTIGSDYTYDKYSNTFNAYITGLAIHYLGKYASERIDFSTEPIYVPEDAKVTTAIEAIPYPGTLKVMTSEGKTYSLEAIELTDDIQSYEADFGTVIIDCVNMKVTIQSDLSDCEMTLVYKTKYPAYVGLDSGAEFLEACIAEKLLTSMGNIKAVCNFSSMANNITADDLRGLGQSIHAEVEKYRAAEKSKFWLGIAAIQ